MMRIKFLLCLLALALGTPLAGRSKVVLSVSNPGNSQRAEVVSFDIRKIWQALDVPEGTPLIVRNAFRQQVASQAGADGSLLIETSVLPRGTAAYTVEVGKPMAYEPFVGGKSYPWRVDDFAWENDKCAYRAYGPALQKTGEQAYGIDIWLKSTPHLDVEKRYESERRGLAEAAALRKQGRAQEADSVLLATTYHRDHGTGLDCYKVGPSLGCGTPAVLLGDSLVLPWCFERYEVKENGPLRFSVELTYPAKQIGKEMLREHRLISLSKGDYFNRMTVWYEGMKKKSQIDVCGGLVVHTKRTADLTLADDFIAYTDPTDNAARHNFEIYVAVVFPDGINETRLIRDPHHERQGIVGNAVGVKRGLTADAAFTYWFGASWHKSGTADQAAWLSQIKRFVSNQRQPLQLSISKKK